MSEPTTLTETLRDLKERGFTANFAVSGQRLRVLGGGRTFGADELAIRGHHRFEGESDPDDMAIVYAIEAVDGTRGVLVDAFGVYANPAVGALLEDARWAGPGPTAGRPDRDPRAKEG